MKTKLYEGFITINTKRMAGNKRICRFCNKEMAYGIQKEVMCKVVTINGKQVSQYVNFDQYGWCCGFKDLDNCDVVFDTKDIETNKALSEEAEIKLGHLLEKERIFSKK